jgi:uncharacterized protein (TIGR02147 family)
LKLELEQRCKRNLSYSLRSFAQALNLKPSHLSCILKRKKGLSLHSAHHIAEVLNMTEEEKQIFCDSVTMQHSRKTDEKEKAKKRLTAQLKSKSAKFIEMRTYKMIADWHYFAILHLFELKEFESNPKWFSKKLSIPEREIESSLRFLDEEGLIDRTSSPWRLKNKFTTTTKAPKAALRNHHHQILQKASEALDSQASEDRDFSSIILSLDSSQIEEAKKWIKKFRRKFCTDLDQSKNKDRIYCLAIQFFNLTNL